MRELLFPLFKVTSEVYFRKYRFFFLPEVYFFQAKP
jgi:hypothetical protein